MNDLNSTHVIRSFVISSADLKAGIFVRIPLFSLSSYYDF